MATETIRMEAMVDFRPREIPPMMIAAEPVSGSRGQLLGGLVVVRGVVLGEVADGAAADEAAEDGDVNAPAVLLGSENE